MTMEFVDNGLCFVCGAKNDLGLKLKLRTDAERGLSSAEVRFPERFQGWQGVVHGGLLATVLDEAMIYAAGAKGLTCVTGEITVRYVTPAKTETDYLVRGQFLADKGRIVLAESEVVGPDGVVFAKASGKLFKIN